MRLLLLLSLLVSLAAGCQRPAKPAFLLADGGRPNLLVITVDTLRADHLGCYGAGAPLSPNIDRLAEGAVLFEQASVTAPVTLPSLVSLFTGRYPGAHPVRTNRGRLPDGIPVLAEILREAGYGTTAYYGNSLLRPESGLQRGFTGYTSFVPPLGGAADEHGASLAVGWLDWENPEPWFLWVHFMDPHGPYDKAPAQYLEGVGDDALPDRVLPLSETNYGLGVLPRYQRLPGVERASDYRRRYRGEVRYTDAQVGRLLRALDERGLAERTLVVLTADHGESLGEHDLYFQHGWFPYEGSVRVPLLVRPPGAAAGGRRVRRPVSLVDVLPTVLAGLGLATPSGIEGRDLGVAFAGGEPEEAAVFGVTAYLNQMTFVRRGSWKLVHTPPPPAPIAAGDPWASYYAPAESWALFDLETDAGETRDRTAGEEARLAALRRELESWQRQHGMPMRLGPAEEAEIDAATRERLEALGYGS